jgi:carboxylesterase type B
LEWIQKYIPDIGGNKDEITAMGISAGAGSILHHMTAEGGKKDPIFRRAIIQSPGYATVLDRAGVVENKFHRIEEMLGCKGKGLDCMRTVSEAELRNVSFVLNSAFAPGASGWDPVVDSILVLNTPTLEIAAGKSHVSASTNFIRD